MRRNVWVAALLVFAMALSGCDGEKGRANGGKVARVVVEPDQVSVIERQSAQLQAVALGANGKLLADVVFDWSSSDEAIATVDENGTVTTIRPGVVTIVAQASSKVGSAVVTVTALDVAALEIESTSTEMSVDGTLTLEAQALDANGNVLLGRTIAWTTSDADVATVENGIVTGVGLGTATIVAALDGYEATVLVSVVHRFVEVVAAAAHTCALNAAGAAWCWGANSSGELGVGHQQFQESRVPVRVATEPGLRFVSLAAGNKFTCGLTAAGDVWCWGDNGSYQLGVDSVPHAHAPMLAPDRRFTAISAMADAVCGLDEAGAAFCWGGNWSYQLGDPDLTDDSPVPVAVSAPVEGEDPLSFVRLAHGSAHSCGLTATGGLHCWGANHQGALGDGSRESRGRPVAPFAEETIVAHGAGDYHHCAADADGTTWCWGDNSVGQSVGSRSPLTEILEPVVRFEASEFTPVAFALGQYHSCGLDAAGAVWCWGVHFHGRLGRSDDSPDPRPIDGGLSFRTLTLREAHTCGIATDDKVYCWGDNYYGMLGTGPTGEFSAVPLPVLGQ